MILKLYSLLLHNFVNLNQKENKSTLQRTYKIQSRVFGIL